MSAAQQEFSSIRDAVEWAAIQDANDELRHFRSQFLIPTKADLKSRTLKDTDETSEACIYLCGNSLGVQPKNTARLVQTFLKQWQKKGVLGHFVDHEDSPLPPFLHVDDNAAKLMAPLVGAHEHEVAIMGTLTGNLHHLMTSFYLPGDRSQGRYKILLEGKAFPSDHYAIESQITLAGYNPKDAMVLLEPEDASRPVLTTESILRRIDQEANELALVLLPAIQFYTGQYFDVKTITAHAHSYGIMVGWDCAHAAGNVDLKLHDWEVDFAVWCTYKYLNSGPGAMAGMFMHEKHGKVEKTADGLVYRPRLTGWWGHDKSTRFEMTNKFEPRPGAAGYQLSNPSALDLAAVVASLELFQQATMSKLREKSIRMTKFLEDLLTQSNLAGDFPPYTIITPREPQARGAQLSVRLKPGLLDKVIEVLEENGVVLDERKPDVIRVAPAPLYNNFTDVVTFYEVFREALAAASDLKRDPEPNLGPT